MKIIKLTKDKGSVLGAIAKELRAGAVIVYPTDTAYALGCDATNAKAVAKIFKIKGRVAAKGLPMIVADAKMAKKFFVLTTQDSQLATRWPSPLSLVMRAKKGIAKAVLQKGTAAVRVPDSLIARSLSKLLGRPLVATSANLSGQPACYSVSAYLKQIHAANLPFAICPVPDLALDAGALPKRRPSTIVKVDNDGRVTVLRQGSIWISH